MGSLSTQGHHIFPLEDIGKYHLFLMKNYSKYLFLHLDYYFRENLIKDKTNFQSEDSVYFVYL